jgi:hypothetical protein
MRSNDIDVSRPTGRGSPLTIGALMEIVRFRRWIFVPISILSFGLIIAYACLATRQYRATTTVMPRQGENAPQLQSLAGQFGGLASLAGVELGGSVDEQEALAYLASRALFDIFARREHLMSLLYAKEWDSTKNQWRSDLKRIPTMNDAWILFDRRVRSVSQDTKTHLVTLQITYGDRYAATRWANTLIQLANEELRQHALLEADASLASLRDQLKEVDAEELRLSIYKLMEAQINRQIAARSRPDYAFAVIDPAVVSDSDKFVAPRRALLFFIAIPLAVFVACCSVILFHGACELLSSPRQLGVAGRSPPSPRPG